MKTIKRIMAFFLIMAICASSSAVYASDAAEAEYDEAVLSTGASNDTQTGDTDTEAPDIDTGLSGEDTGKPKVEISFDELDKSQTIHEGISVGNTDVSGMTPDEALDAVNKEIESLGQLPVTVKVDDRSMELKLETLGFYCKDAEERIVDGALIGQVGSLIYRYREKADLSENEVVYELDFDISEEAVSEYLAENADSYTIEPVNATIKRVGSGFELTESIKGIQIDQGKTVDIIMDSFSKWDHDEITVQASTIVLEPDYNYEDLARIQDCIGSFSTSLSGSANSGKGKNVTVGAGKIDGTVIMPGEEWSIYETLAPFTAENGYDEATAYLNGGYVQELGGGVCQLATTLYLSLIHI